MIHCIKDLVIRPLKKTTYNVKMLSNYLFSFEYMKEFSHNKVSSKSIPCFQSYSTFPDTLTQELAIMLKYQIYAIFELRIVNNSFYFVKLWIFIHVLLYYSDKGMYGTYLIVFRFNLLFLKKIIWSNVQYEYA